MADKSIHHSSGNAGNIYLIFLGVFLILLGSLFTFFMWKSFTRAQHTRSWTATPCLVVKSEVHEELRKLGHNIEYIWQLEYRYQFQGTSYTSHSSELRGQKWGKKKEKFDELVKEFPAGEPAECFVNPEFPEQAILKHDSRGAGYSIWFPMIFAVGGIGMVVGALKKWNNSKNQKIINDA